MHKQEIAMDFYCISIQLQYFTFYYINKRKNMEMSEQSSNDCYSTDQQYFIDLCRGGQAQEIHEFIQTLSQQSKFNWEWTTNSGDNFVHMLSGNNFPQIFVDLIKVIKQRGISHIIPVLINHPNSTGNTPLHYAVITDSKQMVVKLLEFGVDTSVVNEFGRTAFDQAAQFDKTDIAEILAPVTKQDIQKLKQQFGTLDICNENSSQSEQEKQQKTQKENVHQSQTNQQKCQEKQQKYEQKYLKQTQKISTLREEPICKTQNSKNTSQMQQ